MSLSLSLPSSLTPHKTLAPSLARPPVKRLVKPRIRAQQCPFTTPTTPTPPPPPPPPSLSSLALPPGPWRLPFIGSLHHLIGTVPSRRLHELAESHGPVMLLRFGQLDVAVVSSREAANEVMRKQDLKFLDRPPTVATKILSYGFAGIGFANYGPYLRQLRHLCIVEVLSAKRVKSFASLRAEEAMNMVKDVAKLSHSSPHEAVPLSAIVATSVNNTVSRAMFGRKFSEQERFLEVMERVLEMAAWFSFGDFLPWLKVVDALTGITSKLEKVHGELDEIMTAIVEEHEVKRVHGEEEEEEEEALVDVLLRLKNRGDLEVPITMDNIKAGLSDMFMGGTETSSSTIVWAMSELIRHPNIMKKAQEEVRQIMKQKTTIEETYVHELHYLNLVIKETLRLHPPVPLLIPRLCKETCQVLDYKIEAGSGMIINAWALGRDPKYWEDPEIFMPERFKDSLIDFKGNNMEYVPFGAGKRMCPGLTFGLANVELALAHLLFYFDWKLPDGMEIQDLDMSETFGATTTKKSPLNLVAIPRYTLANNL